MNTLLKTLVVIICLIFCCPLSLAVCPSTDLWEDCFVDFRDYSHLTGQWKAGYDSNDLSAMTSEWLTGGIPLEPEVMAWVDIKDHGIEGHEPFYGRMSKYETTNAQYCLFLNAALESNDITVSGNYAYGANGTNGGEDFVGQVYYNLAGAGYTNNGATNGGAARIHYIDGEFYIDSGFENHPVTFVSWYGATAFCNYYGWRLPSEWEWQAVADYDGTYIYGCGTTINNSIANYSNSVHPDGTTVVGDFGTYGYGMADMAGNVYEWTSTVTSPHRVIRGGGWNLTEQNCSVAAKGSYSPSFTYYRIGFRACRNFIVFVPDVNGMPQSEAEAAIAAEGLIAEVLAEYSETVAIGNIISQDPPAGEKLIQGSTVVLVVSKGPEAPDGMVFVSINDLGVIGHEPFNGQMSKYETTNAQFCLFLNSAKIAGTIVVYNNAVYASSDTGHSQPYYNLAGVGYTYNGATSGGAARINYSGGFFTVGSGFENHPVTFVSWYGATAFCNYYKYRLPTEWEWQAVADYNGSFTYGCGAITNSKANYYNSNHPNGTTAVGVFGSYGYGMADMAGNVWEWTSSVEANYRVLRGGCWYGNSSYCTVTIQNYYYPVSTHYSIGFRVCR